MSSQSLNSSQCTSSTMTVTKPPLLAAKKQPAPIYPLTSTINGLSNAVPANSAVMSVTYPAQTINTGVLQGSVSQIAPVNSVSTPMNSPAVQIMPMAGQFQPMFMMPPVIGTQGMFLQPAFMAPQMLNTPQSIVTAGPAATVSNTPPRQAVLPIQQHVNSHTTITSTRNLNQPVSSIRPIVSSTPLQTVSVRPNLSSTSTVPCSNIVTSSAIRPNLPPVRPALPLGQPTVSKASAVVTGSPRSTSSTTTPKPIAAKPTFVSSPANKMIKTPTLAPRGIVNPVASQQSINQACRPIQPAVVPTIQAAPNHNSLPRLAPAAGIRRPDGHMLNHVTMKKKKRALAAVNKALLQNSGRPSFVPSQIRPLRVHIPPTPQLSTPPIMNDRSLLPVSAVNKPPPRAQLVSPMPASKPPSVSQVLVSNPNRPPGSIPRLPVSRLQAPPPVSTDNTILIDETPASHIIEPPVPTAEPIKEIIPVTNPPCATVSPSAPIFPHSSETTPKTLPQDQKSSNPSPSEQTAASITVAQINQNPQSSPEAKEKKERCAKRPATDSRERERRLPSKRTAVVRPEQRRILTHLIDDYVIYESNKPFPVKRGLELVESTLLRQSDSSVRQDVSLSSEREDNESEEDDTFESPDVRNETILNQFHESSKEMDSALPSLNPPVVSTHSEFISSATPEPPAAKSTVSPIRSVVPTRIVIEETQPTVSVSPTKPPATPVSCVPLRPSPIQTKSVEPLVPKPKTPAPSPAQLEALLSESATASRPDSRVPTPSDYLKRNISTWSVADVHHFVLNTPGCHNYASLFKSSEIDGEALLLLSEEHLIQVPISMKVGPALKLSARIEELKHSVH